MKPVNEKNLKVAIGFNAECRAETIGHIQEFGSCLSKHAQDCPFANPFGYTYFCKHPRWREIAELTQEASG